MANNAAIQAAGIKLTTSTTGSPLVFTAKKGEQFQVLASGDASNTLGLGSLSGSTGATTFDVSTVTGGTTTFASGVENLAISIGGAAASSFSVTTATTTTQGALDALNAVFTTNATFQAAGLKAVTAAGAISITSTNGTAFRVADITDADTWGFGSAQATGNAQSTQSAITSKATVDAGGTYQTNVGAAGADVFYFGAIPTAPTTNPSRLPPRIRRAPNIPSPST